MVYFNFIGFILNLSPNLLWSQFYVFFLHGMWMQKQRLCETLAADMGSVC